MSRIWDALQGNKKQGEERAPETPDSDKIHLTPKQKEVIDALLETETFGDAARAAGITEVMLQRWMNRPEFITAYYRIGRSRLEGDRKRLDEATNNAVSVLQRARDLLDQIQLAAERLRAGPPAAGPGESTAEH
jgi:hypothetical protein